MRFVALLVAGCLALGTSAAGAKDMAIPRPAFATRPAASKTAKPVKKESPSMISKLTSAPKRLLTSTKKLLTPKKKPPQKKSHITNVRRNSKSEPPGFLHQLFDREPPPPPRTVEEWMALEQVHP